MPIITLPSTAKNGSDGSVSRIVPASARRRRGHLTRRRPLRHHRARRRYLHGKTIRQRAEALIAGVDPQFRDGLEREPAEAKLLSPDRATVAV